MLDDLHGVEDLLARNEVRKAEVSIAKYLRLPLSDVERARGLVVRAKTRLRSARPEDAMDDLLTARKTLPEQFEQPEIIELLADCHMARYELASVGFADRQDTKAAQQHYEAILKQFPDYANEGWLHYQLGRIALTDNNIDQAEVYLKRALLLPSRVHGLTAFCYERLGFIAFYERRELRLALGLLDKAVDTYPATENPSWLVQVHMLRSRVLREQRKYQAALRSAEQAVAVATGSGPENRASLAEALLTAGELLTGFEGREQDVIEYLQQFLQISKKPLGVDVTWSRVHEMLGDAYFARSQYELASDAYEAALQYNPYHPWSISLHYRLARSYYQRNQYAQTVDTIRRLIDAAASDGEDIQDYRIFDVLGNAYFALAEYEWAVESYRIALDKAPLNAEGLDKIMKYYRFAQELS